MMYFGEIHTGLLQHSASLTPDQCAQVLGFVRGEPVRCSARPIPHAASPELLTGVDCRLPTGSGAKVRGVGTVRHHSTITGGRVAQGSVVTELVTGSTDRRQPWMHYLARPGQVETVGKGTAADVAEGFTSGRSAGSSLDLGAISARALDVVQHAPTLDRSPPFRAGRTKLRWVATAAPAAGVTFRIDGRQLRTLRVGCDAGQLAAVAALCEDLALHDWLLSTVLQLVDRSQIGTAPPEEVVMRLRPAIDHLLHLWMPAARLPDDLLGFWESLELRPGFSRQWRASIDRIRDQVALGTLLLLGAGAHPAR